jgi:hypothetical protein
MERSTRRREAFRRFFLAHLFTYVPAFIWAAAWIPRTVEQNFSHLSAIDDPSRVSDFILRRMIAPSLIAFGGSHVFAIPWIVADEKTKGRTLAFAGTAGVALIGCVYGGIAWIRLLTM